MSNKNIEVYHGYALEKDNMIKRELNKDTRCKLLKKYRVLFVDKNWDGDKEDFDIILEKRIGNENGKLYDVIKNNSSCGGKHLLLLCDAKNLLAFGGDSQGNKLYIYGG